MAARPRIVFHVGGPAFHPVEDQARLIERWLGSEYDCSILEGGTAFERLDDCDLCVLMGLHWTGMRGSELGYQPLKDRHKDAFEAYVGSGRPLLAHHGAIASYDDWPRFGELVGFAWIWGETTHSPIGEHCIRILPTGHPIVQGIQDFSLVDELYYNLRIASGLKPETHAEAMWDGKPRPMVMTAEGGRTPGAGRTAFLANGHDLRAFENPAMRKLWENAVRWSLSD